MALAYGRSWGTTPRASSASSPKSCPAYRGTSRSQWRRDRCRGALLGRRALHFRASTLGPTANARGEGAMAQLPISLGFGSNVRTRRVLDGLIEPEGIELRSTAVHGSELFWRQLRFAEFDVSEMSLSSLLMLTASGKSPWWALPIFTSRQFFHTGILVRTDKGINKPEDLKGKRVGVPEYQQTAALWARGALKHEFGVDPMNCEWWMERVGELSHGGATG